MKATTMRTRRTRTVERHLDWRNIGWFVSWLLFFGFTGVTSVISVFCLIKTGKNPIAEDHTWILCVNLMIVWWVSARNHETPSEYIRRWKNKKGL